MEKMEKIYFKTKSLSVILLLVLLALVPGKAMADELSSYYYTKEDGKAAQLSTLSGYSFAKVESSTTTFSNKTVYVVTEDVEISDRITCGTDVILVLLDGKNMNAKNGITVEGDNSITITSGGSSETIEGTGNLLATTSEANDGEDNAAIGGTAGKDCGSVTINGGTVEVYSSASPVVYGAGIGGGGNVGGDGGSGGTITITGGKVTAYSSKNREGYGAGIGGGGSKEGDGGSGGIITITGGTVTAYSSKNRDGYGAGIGRGGPLRDEDNGDTLYILGNAVVEAKGDSAIYCNTAKASAEDLPCKVEYDGVEWLEKGEVNLLNFKGLCIAAHNPFYVQKNVM